MRVSYGTNNCFVLRINSRQPGQVDEQLPDPWSQYIASNLDGERNDGNQTPDVSPSTVQIMSQSLEIGQELSEETSALPYHPLSPDMDEHDFVGTIFFLVCEVCFIYCVFDFFNKAHQGPVFF